MEWLGMYFPNLLLEVVWWVAISSLTKHIFCVLLVNTTVEKELCQCVCIDPFASPNDLFKQQLPVLLEETTCWTLQSICTYKQPTQAANSCSTGRSCVETVARTVMLLLLVTGSLVLRLIIPVHKEHIPHGTCSTCCFSQQQLTVFASTQQSLVTPISTDPVL